MTPFDVANPNMQDTLAEAYYANRQYDKAAEIERRLVQATDPSFKDYFQKQLSKFLLARDAVTRPASPH